MLELSTPQVPESASEADGAEERLGLLQRVPAPIRFHLVPVPGMREPSRLLWRYRRATGEVTRRAPAIDMLFIPEEQHVFT